VLIDTPGLSFVYDEDADPSTLEKFRACDILLRSKGRIDRLKDPHPPGTSEAIPGVIAYTDYTYIVF
jgi:hypothetical protein